MFECWSFPHLPHCFCEIKKGCSLFVCVCVRGGVRGGGGGGEGGVNVCMCLCAHVCLLTD